MKVKELVGFWDKRADRTGYYMYYTAIIEGRSVIIERCLRSDVKFNR